MRIRWGQGLSVLDKLSVEVLEMMRRARSSIG